MESEHHTVAELPLYRRIHVEDEKTFRLLRPLLKSFITNPDRALYVREVVFTTGSISWDRDIEESPPGGRGPEDAHLFRQTLNKLGLGSAKEQDEWVEVLTGNLNGRFAHHAVMLLLLLCPNVERLVYANSTHQYPVATVMERNNYGSLPQLHLQNLKEVVVMGYDRGSFYDERDYLHCDILRLLRMFHRSPNIESVSTEAVYNDRDCDYETTFPAGTTNIKKISITHSAYDSNITAAFIRAPKALENLTWSTGGPGLAGGGCTIVYAKEIGKALLCQKSSLLTLDLDLDENAGHPDRCGRFRDHELHYQVPDPGADAWQELPTRAEIVDELEGQSPRSAMDIPDDREYGRTIGSLHDFVKLTHLSIGVKFLLGCNVNENGHWNQDMTVPEAPFRLVNALPPNLEYLLVRGYAKGEEPSWDSHMSELMQLKAERLPKLREIHGIEECIPSGKTAENPEEEWKVTINDLGWLEAESET